MNAVARVHAGTSKRRNWDRSNAWCMLVSSWRGLDVTVFMITVSTLLDSYALAAVLHACNACAHGR